MEKSPLNQMASGAFMLIIFFLSLCMMPVKMRSWHMALRGFEASAGHAQPVFIALPWCIISAPLHLSKEKRLLSHAGFNGKS